MATFDLLGAAPVVEWLRLLIISALSRSSSHHYGFEPTCSSGCMWDKPSFACRWSGGFSRGISCFHATYWLTWLKMSEIILTANNTRIKKQQNKKNLIGLCQKYTLEMELTFDFGQGRCGQGGFARNIHQSIWLWKNFYWRNHLVCLIFNFLYRNDPKFSDW